jgi:hypothetical protein
MESRIVQAYGATKAVAHHVCLLDPNMGQQSMQISGQIT